MYNRQSFTHLAFNPMNEALLDEAAHLEGLFPKFPVEKIEEKDDEDEDAPATVIKPQMDFKGKKSMILRYVIACYDPMSPLVNNHKALPARQKAAAKVAGFQDDDPDLVYLFELTDKEQFIPELILNYLREYAQPISYATMVANEALYWEYFRRVIRFDVDADDNLVKAKMAEELSILQTRVEAARTKFFGDDEKLKAAAAATKRVRFTPENMARKDV